jgi:hypothetical protein
LSASSDTEPTGAVRGGSVRSTPQGILLSQSWSRHVRSGQGRPTQKACSRRKGVLWSIAATATIAPTCAGAWRRCCLDRQHRASQRSAARTGASLKGSRAVRHRRRQPRPCRRLPPRGYRYQYARGQRQRPLRTTRLRSFWLCSVVWWRVTRSSGRQLEEPSRSRTWGAHCRFDRVSRYRSGCCASPPRLRGQDYSL